MASSGSPRSEGTPMMPRKPRLTVACTAEEGMTRQADARDADINVIVKRFGGSGVVPNLSGVVPVFADVSAIGDFQTVQENMRRAHELFDGMPEGIREQFDGDYGRFGEWLLRASPEDLEAVFKPPKEVSDAGEVDSVAADSGGGDRRGPDGAGREGRVGGSGKSDVKPA